MSLDEHLARASQELHRRTRGITPDPAGVLRRRGSRRRTLAAVAIFSLGAAGVLINQSLDSGQSTEVATRNRPGSDSSAPPAAPAPESCQDPNTVEDSDGTTIFVYFFCGDAMPPEKPVAVPRVVPKTDQPLRASLQEFLKGPTERERRLGLGSVFDQPRTDLLVAAVIRDETAWIDFSPDLAKINNITASDFQYHFHRALNATVFQFKTVNRIIYRVEKSPEKWCRIFEAECEPILRDQS